MLFASEQVGCWLSSAEVGWDKGGCSLDRVSEGCKRQDLTGARRSADREDYARQSVRLTTGCRIARSHAEDPRPERPSARDTGYGNA